MFQTRLKPVLKGSRLSLMLPRWNRILFMLVTMLLLLGIYYSDSGSPRLWIPWLLAFFSILGGLYTEKWIFDSNSRRGTYYRGIAFLPLPFLTEHADFDFDDIELLDLKTINKHKTESSLLVVLKSGKKYEIDSLKGKESAEALGKTGMVIAEFTGTVFKG